MQPDLVRLTTTARIPTEEGTFQLSHYIDTRDGKEHLALVMGNVADQHNILVRVHSECFTGDVLGSQRCDCGEQLHQAMRLIAQEGQGVILYLRQEGRGIGLADKLKAYNLQDQGYDTVDANLMLGHQADEREYSAGAEILSKLGILSIRLMTNNPAKIDHLEQLGIRISGRLPLSSTVTQDNAAYLATKIQRMRHLLTLPAYTNGNHHHATHHSLHHDTHDNHNQNHHEPTGHTAEIESQLAAIQARGHSHHATHGLPLVTLSYAQTLNGTIGSVDGGPLRISGPESLIVTHRLRAQHDAILIGIGTLLADDPKLTTRLVEGPSPQPVIIDSHLRTPLDSQLWSHPRAPWVATLDDNAPGAKGLRERGARIFAIPASQDRQLDLSALLVELGRAGIRSLMVEGGASIIASLVRQQLAHVAVITVAPSLAPGIHINSTSLAAIHHPTYTRAGGDMILWGELTWAGPRPHASNNGSSNAGTQAANLATSPTATSTL